MKGSQKDGQRALRERLATIENGGYAPHDKERPEVEVPLTTAQNWVYRGVVPSVK